MSLPHTRASLADLNLWPPALTRPPYMIFLPICLKSPSSGELNLINVDLLLPCGQNWLFNDLQWTLKTLNSHWQSMKIIKVDLIYMLTTPQQIGRCGTNIHVWYTRCDTGTVVQSLVTSSNVINFGGCPVFSHQFPPSINTHWLFHLIAKCQNSSNLYGVGVYTIHAAKNMES